MNTEELRKMNPYLEITDPDEKGHFRYEIRNDKSINYGGNIDSLTDLSDVFYNNYKGAFQNLLNEKYINLKIYLTNRYEPCIRVYVRGKDSSKVREAFPQEIYLSYPDVTRIILQEFNERAGEVRADMNNKFICSCCGQVKDMNTEFAENVFASYFCKDCAKKPEIASLISDSHKPNYYD